MLNIYFMILLYVIHAIVIFFMTFHAIGWIISITKTRNNTLVNGADKKFATIITAYKNVEITAPLIESLLKQTYTNYEIFLVADCCNVELAKNIESKYSINLILPQSPLNSKIKSIKTIVNQLDNSFDAIVIFDPDNLAHPNFLDKINNTMKQGFEAVQGLRTAKNLDTQIACLDALGEFYYSVNTRVIPFAIGSSATIAGSGMAIDLQLYKSYLLLDAVNEADGKVVIAEDKILQTYIVQSGKTIAFEQNAIVYDEKIETSTQLQRQRTRWINTWFKHASEGTSLLFSTSWNSVWFAFLTFYPPMFLQWLLATVLIIVDLLYFPDLALLVFSAMYIYIIHFIHSLFIAKAPKTVFLAIVALPMFVSKQLISLLQMKKSNKDFMVTEHTKTIRFEELNLS